MSMQAYLKKSNRPHKPLILWTIQMLNQLSILLTHPVCHRADVLDAGIPIVGHAADPGEAARVLRRAGARQVDAVVFARGMRCDVRVHGDEHALITLDVSNPSHPVEFGRYPLSEPNPMRVVTAGNLASERVLQKAGFKLAVKTPDAHSIGGKRYADHIYHFDAV